MNTLIDIKDLSIGFYSNLKKTNVVKSISFQIPKGKTVALVGESGSGKTVTALSILKLLPYPSAFHNSGKIIYKNKDLLKSNDSEIQQIRGNKITSIFQEPMTSLNPLHTVEKQINEVIMIHNNISYLNATKKTQELLNLVGLENISTRIKSYPYELSGGQRQRVMIAMSIANEPDLLIADEPTTALDVTIQNQIIDLIIKIQKKMNMSILFISHDLAVVKKISDYICIMKDGEIVEQNHKNEIFYKPQHQYTKQLISSHTKEKDNTKPSIKKILKVSNLKVWYPIKKGILRKIIDHVKAVNFVNFDLAQGQTLGIVGESGSGKTSLVLSLLKLISSDGEILFNNENLNKISSRKMKLLRKEMQIVFQDPFSSLSPRMTVQEIVSEGLKVHESFLSTKEKNVKIRNVLEEVGLNYESTKDRFPHEFSGGQRQRIAIARALILSPKLIIFDEPTSALDVNIQAQILKMLNEIQESKNLSYIFISHDMKVIKAVSDYIIVLKNGKIVEEGNKNLIFNKPKNNYTKELISSIV